MVLWLMRLIGPAALLLALWGCASLPTSCPPAYDKRECENYLRTGIFVARYWLPHNDPAIRQQTPPPVFPYADMPPFKWPEAPHQTHGLDLTKRDYDTAKAYYKWLCEHDAGAWFYRTVSSGGRYFEMRPGWKPSLAMVHDRYYLEMPTDYNGFIATRGEERPLYHDKLSEAERAEHTLIGIWLTIGVRISAGPRDTPEDRAFINDHWRYIPESQNDSWEKPMPEHLQAQHPGYRFLRYTREQPSTIKAVVYQGQTIQTYEGNAKYKPPIRIEPTNELRARYGFTWRGIERSIHDRELGIAGGEWLVIDLKTGELLGLHRTFMLDQRAQLYGENYPPGSVNWGVASSCPSNRSITEAGGFTFLRKVFSVK